MVEIRDIHIKLRLHTKTTRQRVEKTRECYPGTLTHLPGYICFPVELDWFERTARGENCHTV